MGAKIKNGKGKKERKKGKQKMKGGQKEKKREVHVNQHDERGAIQAQHIFASHPPASPFPTGASFSVSPQFGHPYYK